ncbi:kinase non-catalytic C-lobe domain-containing protein 1 [Polypterus senegalus]|uniref:kinase non-catalytic C-lobe domain-containing protein 1 n=1 Tax=Polypterus senegalus TaxID=55291 RepID=UPI001963C376|nr:kinase non-catalytic C-lobe domain-containing protein 1 [Polypterus senegalus]
MGTFETAVASYLDEMGEDEGEEYCDFEPLPALLEDEENVSLMDILSLRDNCLTEQEIWAICQECAISIKSIDHSALFHTLCITPDTLAFNANGNVCFMEQQSDDPEGAFVPPEFDRTGNTFEAHIYSLAATLTAAINYVIEPELEPQLSEELKMVLEKMQQDNPEDRPNIESVISISKEQLKCVPSAVVCRKLSSIGRKVLSIESVCAFQECNEILWMRKDYQLGAGHALHDYVRNPADGSSSTEDLASDSSLFKNQTADVTHSDEKQMQTSDNSTGVSIFIETINLTPQEMCNDRVRNDANKVYFKPKWSDTVLVQQNIRKNSPVEEVQIKATSDISLHCAQNQSLATVENIPCISSLSENKKSPLLWKDTSNVLNLIGLSKFQSISNLNESDTDCEQNSPPSHPISEKSACISDVEEWQHPLPETLVDKDSMNMSHSTNQESLISYNNTVFESMDTSGSILARSHTHSVSTQLINHTEASECDQNMINPFSHGLTLGKPNNTRKNNQSPVFKSPAANDCWVNDDVQNAQENYMTTTVQTEWTSLKDFLSQCGRPLSVNELWALCYICLYSLQPQIHFPAFLSLDTVYIGRNGEVMFLNVKSTGQSDAFFLAPEFQEHGIATEKVCVYGVAAVLWAAAKFNCSPNQKLVLPRKLKRLLLEMAKGTPDERPSIAVALQACSDHLFQQGIDPHDIWAKLISCIQQPYDDDDVDESDDTVEDEHSPSANEPSDCRKGFMPVAGENKLNAIKGPLPCKYPVNSSCGLPDAFMSPATHFKPIILKQNAELQSPNNEYKNTSTKQYVKAVKKEIQQKKGQVPVNDIENDVTGKGSGEDQEKFQNVTSKERNSSPASSKEGPQISPLSAFSDTQRKSNFSSTFPSSSSQSLSMSDNSSINNFLLRQDPKTGNLTLLPVQVAISKDMVGLDFNVGHISSSLHKLPLNVEETDSVDHSVMSPQPKNNMRETDENILYLNFGAKEDINKENANELALTTAHSEPRLQIQTINCASTSAIMKDPRTLYHSEESMKWPTSLHSNQRNPSLEEAVHLIKEEFAFDGYLENGVEDVAMGQYILSLKNLQFQTFSSAISEKFCDLYWDEKLLEKLYAVVNGKFPETDKSDLKCFTDINNSGSLPVNIEEITEPAVQKNQMKIKHPSESNSLDWNREKVPTQKQLTTEFQSLQETEHLNLSAKTSLENGNEIENISLADLNDNMVNCLSGSELNSETGNSKEECNDIDLVLLSANIHDMLLNDISNHDANENSEKTILVEKQQEFDFNSQCYTKETCQLSLDYAEDSGDGDSLPSERTPDNIYSSSSCRMNTQKCSPGWQGAFYGVNRFGVDVLNYVKTLGQQCKECHVQTKMIELQQQLMIETKNYKKTRTFYQKLLHQHKKHKGSDSKLILPKLKMELEEMRSKVEFLNLSKNYLDMLFLEQWGIEPSLLTTLAVHGTGDEAALLNHFKDTSFLTFHTVKMRGKGHLNSTKILQAGTPLGLMCHLFARKAFLEGYVQQFLYTFRYFCSPKEFLQFLINTFNSAISLNCTTDLETIHNRTLDLLQAWIEDCRQVDFTPNTTLLNTLEDFIRNKVIPVDSRGEQILAFLQSKPEKKRNSIINVGFHPSISIDDNDSKSLHALSKKLSREDSLRKSFHWKPSRSGETHNLLPNEKQYTIAALPRPFYASVVDAFSGSSLKSEEKNPLFQTEYGTLQIHQQLTLLQQEMFQKCHPVHFLNSRALGVQEKTQKTSVYNTVPVEGSNLFSSEISQDKYLLQLLRYADNISNWVAAEIVICDTTKMQTSLLSKFLLIGKLCYETRNFATAIQILTGLENVIVRQLPAWKNLTTKVSEIMEELKAVQVFLKSDNLCLMEGDRFKKLPTIPSAHVLAMHVQQLEIGALTMANGAYKWPKLRNIAKVVSQIHAFQDHLYTFAPDLELQAYLRHRVSLFAEADIPQLAADNSTNFHQLSTPKHSRKIQDTIRKMKATFQ